MLRDPFVREKFTREQSFARKLAQEYFERFSKDRYQTEVENWRNLQSANIEFTMKRLRDPIEAGSLCEDCGWVVKLTRADRGKATTLAPAGLPALHALGVTCLIRTGRRGCRMASGRSSTRRAGVIETGQHRWPSS